MYTCFFIGHRDAPQSIYPELLDILECLVTQHQVTHFIVGHYGDFDRMTISAIQKIICSHPETELIAEILEPYFLDRRDTLLPYHFTGFCYPEGLETVPKRFCIEKANQLALDQADYLVAYVSREGGNSAKLLRRAKKRALEGRLHIIRLAA